MVILPNERIRKLTTSQIRTGKQNQQRRSSVITGTSRALAVWLENTIVPGCSRCHSTLVVATDENSPLKLCTFANTSRRIAPPVRSIGRTAFVDQTRRSNWSRVRREQDSQAGIPHSGSARSRRKNRGLWRSSAIESLPSDCSRSGAVRIEMYSRAERRRTSTTVG